MDKQLARKALVVISSILWGITFILVVYVVKYVGFHELISRSFGVFLLVLNIVSASVFIIELKYLINFYRR